MSSGQGNLPVLVHVQETCTTPKEKLLKLLLVKVNDQSFSNRPEGLIIALRHFILSSGECSLQRSRHFVFYWFEKRKCYKHFEEKLQVIKKNYKNSLLKFLRKCVDRSLVSARTLYPFDDVNDRVSNSTAWEFFLAWFWKFLESERFRVSAHWVLSLEDLRSKSLKA